MYDTIIVGGGPAGLSAALILGRCRRRVLVCDAGRPRNAVSCAVHGFLSRDGVDPWELRAIARAQLAPYEVEVRDVEVTDARRVAEGFEVELRGRTWLRARTLLLATGLLDAIPDIPGFAELYGRGVYTCPYCDGAEVRDRPLAVYGDRPGAASLALLLKTWSDDVTLCVASRDALATDDAIRLARNTIAVCNEPIVELEAVDGRLARIVFASGAVRCAGLFLKTGQVQCSPLPGRLGCRFDDRAAVPTDRYERSGIPGLFVAGDASEDAQLAIVAAAEGAKAAIAINSELQRERER